jgi:hypothetical protein
LTPGIACANVTLLLKMVIGLQAAVISGCQLADALFWFSRFSSLFPCGREAAAGALLCTGV